MASLVVGGHVSGGRGWWLLRGLARARLAARRELLLDREQPRLQLQAQRVALLAQEVLELLLAPVALHLAEQRRRRVGRRQLVAVRKLHPSSQVNGLVCVCACNDISNRKYKSNLRES